MSLWRVLAWAAGLILTAAAVLAAFLFLDSYQGWAP
jgi:hypothetical protein